MTGMREHDARAYADASTEHDAPAYATDGRTDGLTQKHSPNAESSPSVSRAGGQNDSTPSQPVSDLSVPVPQPNPSAEDGWVRFYFDDADPVAECACGWHTHGDSASDAFGAWWKHRRGHDDAAGEQRPVVLSARVDLDEIERRIARLDTDEYNQGVPKNAPWRAHASCSGRDRWVIYQPTGSDQSRVITEGLRQPFADFIAHAREDVPRLVAEVRRLRERTCQHIEAGELNAISDLRVERDAARAEAEELRQAYRTVCDYAEQHDATRAELNEARAEAERLREDAYEEKRRAEQSRSAAYQRLVEDRDRYLEAWQASVAEAARVREALQAIRDLHHRIVLHDWCNHADRDACSAFETVDGDWVCGEPVGDACAECEEDGEHVVTWPCPTVRALDAALDGAE